MEKQEKIIKMTQSDYGFIKHAINNMKERRCDGNVPAEYYQNAALNVFRRLQKYFED